ncbi:gamma-glutamylcyclotransferase [Myxococcus sp. Y35]|uniref:gamma-glutamylcyclotransferase n=1 Tax=Pseudomyxococcus flavus TaxID=3115648 RepID=UPI003CF9ED86
MAAGPTAPRPWFAYSLDLAPVMARERLPGLPPIPDVLEGELAEALDVDVVYDVASAAWGGKVARLVDAPGRKLPGMLRRVEPEDWDALSRLEAALAGATAVRPVKVRTFTGAVLTAYAFTPAAPATPAQGLVSESFLVTLALSAEQAGLSPDHVERLQAEARIVQALQKAGPGALGPSSAPGKKG